MPSGFSSGFTLGFGSLAQYKLLQPHYVQNAFLDQGTTVTEGVQIPNNWVPTLMVDPLNSQAVTAFYNAGPRQQNWENMNPYGQENYTPPSPVAPVTHWAQTSPGVYRLTGLGSSLAPVNGV